VGGDGARLRVAIDMSLAVVGITGVERVAAVLHDELGRRPDVEVHSFAAGRGAAPPGLEIGRRYRLPLRILHPLWRTLRLPRAEQLAGDVDVVHGLGGWPPPTRKPLVLMVHDLLPLSHPRFFTERTIREAHGLAAGLARAAIVHTTCEHTASEIVRLTSYPRERIVVAPLGPRGSGRAQGARSEEYLLGVGAITPRKGWDVLADACAMLGPASPPVLIAGPDGFFADEARARVAERDAHRKIRFLGPVDDDKLDALIAGATLVCHPSYAEGFGMVCLEAMNHGAPVVAADIPSVREIGGEAVRLVPPGDPAAFAGALRSLLDDPDERGRLGSVAAERAKRFTWRGFVEGVVEAYQRASGTISR
jgi:glycosyltransferase involved in cell wall biosynthesis